MMKSSGRSSSSSSSSSGWRGKRDSRYWTRHGLRSYDEIIIVDLLLVMRMKMTRHTVECDLLRDCASMWTVM